MLSIKLANKRTLLVNLCVAILYTLEYRYAYLHYVIARFEYSNLTYSPLSGSLPVLLFQSVLPFIFYRGFKNIASGLSFFIYLFVYVPFVVTLHVADFPIWFRVSAGLVFFVIMCLYFITDNKSVLSHFYIKKRSKLKFQHFEILVLGLFLLAVIINRSNLTFVNFLSADNALYELRAEDYVGNLGKFNIYLTLWLSHAFIPILLVAYYMDRKWLKFGASIFGLIVMFMIDKQKITFIIPFVMWAMLYVYRKRRNFLERYFHIFIMSSMALLSLFLTNRVEKTDNIAFQGIAMIVVLRTQCIEGEQLDRYAHFFEMKDNPYTYYTHIRFINKLTGAYPFPKSIGEMVADNEGSNSNATFLLMDGLAAAGLAGCIFISILFILIKSILNAMGRKYQNTLLLIIMLFAIFSLLNTSLFTSLLSFGFIIIYFSLFFFKFPSLENK